MTEYNNILKIAESSRLALDLKNKKTVFQNKENNNSNKSKTFKEILKEVESKEKKLFENQQTIEVTMDNDISTLPSMQINQVLSIKIKM